MVIVVVDGEVSLREPDDLSTLSVRVSGSSETAARAMADAGAGEVRGAHAWLDLDWLRRAAGTRDAAWDAGFRAMVDYAAGRGWVSDDCRLVRAHVESDSASR